MAPQQPFEPGIPVLTDVIISAGSSLPPLARWDYASSPAPGSREADLLAHLRPIDWLGRG